MSHHGSMTNKPRAMLQVPGSIQLPQSLLPWFPTTASLSKVLQWLPSAYFRSTTVSTSDVVAVWWAGTLVDARTIKLQSSVSKTGATAALGHQGEKESPAQPSTGRSMVYRPKFGFPMHGDVPYPCTMCTYQDVVVGGLTVVFAEAVEVVEVVAEVAVAEVAAAEVAVAGVEGPCG